MPTLFHISDLHFGAEDKAALDWFKQEIAREKPDAVICTGDFTMRGTVREFDAAGDYLLGLAFRSASSRATTTCPITGRW
jgi:3',5'-cyclic AMP phosphodiesterase CpdA